MYRAGMEIELKWDYQTGPSFRELYDALEQFGIELKIIANGPTSHRYLLIGPDPGLDPEVEELIRWRERKDLTLEEEANFMMDLLLRTTDPGPYRSGLEKFLALPDDRRREVVKKVLTLTREAPKTEGIEALPPAVERMIRWIERRIDWKEGDIRNEHVLLSLVRDIDPKEVLEEHLAAHRVFMLYPELFQREIVKYLLTKAPDTAMEEMVIWCSNSFRIGPGADRASEVLRYLRRSMVPSPHRIGHQRFQELSAAVQQQFVERVLAANPHKALESNGE